MQCYHCKHDFCWMCLGDWKTHGSEYYECSRYKENPNIAHESAHAQAREALKKYLHYYERVSQFVFYHAPLLAYLLTLPLSMDLGPPCAYRIPFFAKGINLIELY